MGLIKPSKNQVLLANQPKGQKVSGQPNKKQKKFEKKPHTDQAHDRSSSKDDSSKKEKPTFSYCKRSKHEENSCYKKDIDELKHLEKNIDLPSRMFESTYSNSKQLGSTKVKGHAGLASKAAKNKGKALCAT